MSRGRTRWRSSNVSVRNSRGQLSHSEHAPYKLPRVLACRPLKDSRSRRFSASFRNWPTKHSMRQNARGAIALNSPARRLSEDESSQLAQVQVVIFQEVCVMQVIEKPGAKALRRGIRTSKEVAIRLIGCDERGREFVEQPKTVVLSRYGASILSTHKLGVEQQLVVIQEHNNREAEIRALGEIGYEDSLHTYGVTFLDPDIDFCGIEFDSATDAYTSDASMSLQCNICGRCEGIDLDGLESDIYAIHTGLIRDCKHCHRSTLWNRRPAEAPESVGAPQFVAGSAESAPPVKRAPLPAGSKNRRQHMRIKLNFTGGVHNSCSQASTVVSDTVPL